MWSVLISGSVSIALFTVFWTVHQATLKEPLTLVTGRP